MSALRAARFRIIACLCFLALALIGVDGTAGAPMGLRSAPSSAEQDGTPRPTVAMPDVAERHSGDTTDDRVVSRAREIRRADPSAFPSASPAGGAVSTPAAMYEGDDHGASEGTQSTYFLARAVSLASFVVLAGVGLLAARQRRTRHERRPEQ